MPFGLREEGAKVVPEEEREEEEGGEVDSSREERYSASERSLGVKNLKSWSLRQWKVVSGGNQKRKKKERRGKAHRSFS
jgi:hypothetical protein